MDMEPQVTKPPNYPIWRQRANGRTTSVVQSILNREVGPLFYSSVTESVSNFYNESSICRHLMMARTPDKNTDDFPYLLHFPSNNVPVHLMTDIPDKHDQRPILWFKVGFHYKHKLALINGFFWETERNKSLLHQTTVGLPNDNIYRFHGLPPDVRNGFKLLWKTNNIFHGRLAAHDELYQGLRLSHVKTKQSACLVTLSENGCVSLCKWFDKNPSQIRLKNPVSYAKFTELTVNNDSDEIIITATQSGNAQMVYVLKYIKEMGRLCIERIIHVGFPLKVEFVDSMVIIGSDKHLMISSWELFLSATQPSAEKISKTQDAGTLCADEYKSDLVRMPQILEQLETSNTYLGFGTGFWPPQFYIKQSKGLRVKFKIGHVETLETLWEFKSTAHNESAVIAFPDESPRFLYTENDEYGVITLKRAEDGSVVVDTDSKMQPFDLPDQPVTFFSGLRTRPTLPRATKVDLSSTSTTMHVFGLEYCSELGLLAVCSSRNDEANCLHISLYEANNLTLWKELQPLYAWPCYSPYDTYSRFRKGRYTMKNFTMSFNHDILTISMEYDDDPTQDFFFIQLF
ncbi:unnamed protein product [Orchesella dallaii]|uniref:DDB1-and CUL4-associated factor 17 n=1 Tax=Orchesella dallaii TaxID=48710 RepID=A0ABP1PXE7_9HEXA